MVKPNYLNKITYSYSGQIGSSENLKDKMIEESQARQREHLAYLAGVIDGEGSIFISNGQFTITISNTNLEFLKEVQRISKEEGIEFRLENSGNNTEGKAWKVGYRLKVSNKKDVLFLLKKIVDFLICKKAQAVTMIDILEKRTEFEIGFDIIKNLNRKGPPIEEEEGLGFITN